MALRATLVTQSSRVKTILAVLIVVLVVTAILLFVFANPVPPANLELVTNGNFEDGMSGWRYGSPLALGGLEIVQGISNGGSHGSHSVRLVGPGQGFIQNLTQKEIIPNTQLTFSTLLESKEGENEPQALFHLYFFPVQNGPTYYVDVTVTHENSEDLALTFEPNPGIDRGGIYLRFNREPLNSWVNITIDVSKLIENYFPDFPHSRLSGILLESAEGGAVYFHNISVKTADLDAFTQSLYIMRESILYGTLGKELLLTIAIVSPVVSSGLWIFKHLEQTSSMKPSQHENKSEQASSKRRRR